MPIACEAIPSRPPSSAIIAMRNPRFSLPEKCRLMECGKSSNRSDTVVDPADSQLVFVLTNGKSGSFQFQEKA